MGSWVSAYFNKLIVDRTVQGTPIPDDCCVMCENNAHTLVRYKRCSMINIREDTIMKKKWETHNRSVTLETASKPVNLREAIATSPKIEREEHLAFYAAKKNLPRDWSEKKEFAGFELKRIEKESIKDLYFDTPNLELFRASASLRIRHLGEIDSIAFKQQEHQTGALLHQELEILINRDELDLIKKGESVVQPILSANGLTEGSKLHQVLEVHTNRTTFILDCEGEQVHFSLNQLCYINQERRSCDMEIELVNDSALPSSYERLARYLLQKFGLVSVHTSAYKRAIKVLDLDKIN
ncbi:MAG: CYTH domain protein [bacterium ADurb.Bin400]|nr:MAG: CYTH domain protein [bacterium ADurb.Bin400]